MIQPARDINFGALVVNNKKQRIFTIENRGNYEFRYVINKYADRASEQPPAQQGKPGQEQRTKYVRLFFFRTTFTLLTFMFQNPLC